MKILAALALCLLLCGCDGLPRAREMGDMALLRTMGVDGDGQSVTLSVSTGPRAKGLQAEGQPALVLSAKGDSLSSACLSLQGQSDSYVFFGHVDQLLVGEELARQGMEPVLDYFARDSELGMDARLWVVRGDRASQAVTSGGDEGVEARLSTLRTDGKMGVALQTRAVGEIYADLLEWGAAFVPALSLVEQEDTTLAERGYGVLKGDALAGFLDGEAAEGLELLIGHPERDMLSFEFEGESYVLQVLGADTAFYFRDKGRKLLIQCRVEAGLEEFRARPDGEAWEKLARALEGREQARIGAALDQLRAWRADCVGAGTKAGLYSPGVWERLREGWPEALENMEVEIRVEAVLRR